MLGNGLAPRKIAGWLCEATARQDVRSAGLELMRAFRDGTAPRDLLYFDLDAKQSTPLGAATETLRAPRYWEPAIELLEPGRCW